MQQPAALRVTGWSSPTQEEGASQAALAALRAAHTHIGMAGAENSVRAAVPAWSMGLQQDFLYRRTNHIHEMRCEDVGFHLYSQMCCAGRSECPWEWEEESQVGRGRGTASPSNGTVFQLL
ncbi:hypothetical protein GOODEAATRI_011605 [Goodea atripinnis]|uniref:Uncharacterized protein n=1 Tax=Goodea atripinnis TaxID=208336 RepID=A0ABV0P5B3_9TELE